MSLVTQQFLAKTFPLSVRYDTTDYAIEWFHDVGILSIAGCCVVKVWPHHTALEGKREHENHWFRKTYGYGWLGLEFRIVEHGVGEVDRASFSFEQCCINRCRVNSLLAEQHYAEPAPRPLAIVTESGSATGPLPDWECEAPSELRAEFLTPIERYIGRWL